jgi:hypothetical protein
VASRVSPSGGPDSIPAASRPTVREVRELVREWYARPGNEVGGALHVVLDDGNFEACFLRGHREELAAGPLAVAILDALAAMSRRQRDRACR